MSYFACPNYRSVLTRRDHWPFGYAEVTNADGRLSFLSDGNPISEVFA